MENSITKLEIFNQELATFYEALDKFSEINCQHEYYNALRDSIIKRFEYCTDTMWKLLKEVLKKDMA